MSEFERWQQVKDVLHHALERESSSRAAFVVEACAGDESLREEVVALLASHERAGSFFDKSLAEDVAGVFAADQAELRVGQSVGPYQIISQLGVGGMGEVYLAEDARLGRKVALKLLPSYFTQDRDRVRRFRQEARSASALNHPNIITIHEIGEVNDQQFIVTEFIDGETLRERMNRARMTLSEALDIAMQVTSALAEAHRAGIIHRDIKPENIMVRDSGLVKVLDFGLAKLTEKSVTQATGADLSTFIQTDPLVVMGTVNYMSPEQARGFATDARSDIFSLGVVLYEMITGRKPFEGETVADTLIAVLQEEPLPLGEQRPEVPVELERIVKRALQKEREKRYQTAEELLHDLKNLSDEREFAAKLKQSAMPSASGEAATTGSGRQRSIKTVGELSPRPTSSAEYIVTEIKHHKRGTAIFILATLIIAIAIFASFHFLNSNKTINSLAVLPFVNATADPNMEYLSDGISESLINSLSQLPQLKIIARSSSFKYKGKDADPEAVAKALGVEAILTGRVTQRGENLLINVELMDARDRTQVWGEQYNRKAADLLQVQAEISREIAERLRLRLSVGEQQQLSKRETVNPQAYELLLRARFYWRRGGTDNQKKAVEYYQQAIALDPNYSLAYAELSASYSNLVSNSELDPKEFTPKAEVAVLKALALDETLADAHLALANFKANAWDWAAAEHEYRRAIELNPNLAEAYRWYASYLSVMERHEQAIAAIKRARELDPLSLHVSADVGWTLLSARQCDEAIADVKRTLELDHNFPKAHNYLGYIYAAKGMYAEAIAAYQETIRLGEQSPSIQIYLGAAYARSGEREKAQAILTRLQTSKEYVSPGELAILYGSLGERDQAFASLEKAYAMHDLQLVYLGVDPAFDPLRSDPRFADLVRRVGLPEKLTDQLGTKLGASTENTNGLPKGSQM